MIWKAYIDEADTHGAPVMAMGGFLATAGKWQSFDEAWANLLLVNSLQYSHAVDLLHRKKQFRGWDDARHNTFVLSAQELINKYLGAGFVTVLRRDDYHNCYKKLPKPRKPPEDTMLGVLLRASVSFCCAIMTYEFKQEVENESINFVLERGGAKEGYVCQLYRRFQTDPLADPIIRSMLGPKPCFAHKRKSPGCQAADLMLGGAIRQERTEHGFASSDIATSSFADPTKPVNYEDVATFRIPVTRDILQSLRNDLFVEANYRRQWWENSRSPAGQ